MQPKAWLPQMNTMTARQQACHTLTDRDFSSRQAQQPEDTPCPGHVELSGHVQCPAHELRADTDAAESPALCAIMHAYASSSSGCSSACEDESSAAGNDTQPGQQHATDAMQLHGASVLQRTANASPNAAVDSSPLHVASLASHAPPIQHSELLQQQQQLVGVTQPSTQHVLPYVVNTDAFSRAPISLDSTAAVPADPESAVALGPFALPSPSAVPDASADQPTAQVAALPAKHVPAAPAADEPLPAVASVQDDASAATVPQEDGCCSIAPLHEDDLSQHAAPHERDLSSTAGPAAGDVSAAAAVPSVESPVHATASYTGLQAAAASTDQLPTALPPISTVLLCDAPASSEVPAVMSPTTQPTSAAAPSADQLPSPAAPSHSGAMLDPPVPQADSNGSYRQTHRWKPDKRKRVATFAAAAVEPPAQRRKPGRQKAAAAATPAEAEPSSHGTADTEAQPVRRSSRHCAGRTVASNAADEAQGQRQLRTRGRRDACKVRAISDCVLWTTTHTTGFSR